MKITEFKNAIVFAPMTEGAEKRVPVYIDIDKLDNEILSNLFDKLDLQNTMYISVGLYAMKKKDFEKVINTKKDVEYYGYDKRDYFEYYRILDDKNIKTVNIENDIELSPEERKVISELKSNYKKLVEQMKKYDKKVMEKISTSKGLYAFIRWSNKQGITINKIKLVPYESIWSFDITNFIQGDMFKAYEDIEKYFIEVLDGVKDKEELKEKFNKSMNVEIDWKEYFKEVEEHKKNAWD